MNILVFTPSYFPRQGGVERSIFELYRRLDRAGVTVTILTPRHVSSSSLYERLWERSEVIRVWSPFRSVWIRFLWWQFIFLLRMLPLLFTRRYDFVHCYYVMPLGTVAYLMSIFFRAALVFDIHHLGSGLEIHSPEENPRIINPYMRFLLRRAVAIVNHNQTQSRFLQWLDPGLRYGTIPFGVTLPFVDIKKHATFTVLTVGRLVPRKQMTHFLRAARMVCDLVKNIRFEVVGYGTEYQKLSKLLHKLELTENVVLRGQINDTQLAKAYAQAHVFVSTSAYEGFGLVFLEAMAAGLPVIAYAIEAANEIITPQKHGWLVEKDNIQALARSILSAYHNQEHCRQIGCYNRREVQSKYSWNDYAEYYRKLFGV